MQDRDEHTLKKFEKNKRGGYIMQQTKRKSEILVGARTFTQISGRETSVEYYFLKDYRTDEEERPLCGIKVIKEEQINGEIKVEEEVAPALSYSERFVKQIINTMIRNLVTPIHMLEVIDEYMTNEEASCS
jgi:hypothetical protein